ncbi:MAG TPA: TlpA disulfide reductase family protein [Mucilaginibacter sp.]|nr:TlpA disulfide reductase family protein [Mucilaginibacter sp.]
MKRIIILSFLLLVTINYCNAQSFQSTLQQLQSLHYASYTEIIKFKASFQDEISIDTFKNQVNFIPAEPQIGGHFSIKGRNDVYLFDGNKCIWLNLRDSTYEIEKDANYGQECRTLLYWAKEMAAYAKNPSKIKRLKDTVINKIAYDHTLVTIKDTTEKLEHVYDYVDIVTGKVSHLPFVILSRIHGFADDGALISFIEEHIFIDYQFHKKNFPDLSNARVPENFRLPVKVVKSPMLTGGTKAPEIKLTDATGKPFDIAQLKGRLVLLNFTTNGCPHCINAAQMLKRLNDKYKSAAVSIISIYQLGVNSKESVAKFDRKYEVQYPSYTTEKTAADIYHLQGYPNFYLLDKQGNIAQAYDGFYAELEKELTDKIEQLK